MNQGEKIHVKSKKVSCDGEIDDHPLVYLNMGEKDFVTCPYCERYFTIDNSEKNTQAKNETDARGSKKKI